MKPIIILLFLFAVGYGATAQSDTLQIKLKNGDIEKIAVTDIKLIKFENVPSGIEENWNIQAGAKNFPNPFSEGTTIEFEMENPGTVEVIIYDNGGNLIQTLTCENCPPGKNQWNWDTRNKKGETVPSGIYYYEIRTDKKTFAKQMLKVR